MSVGLLFGSHINFDNYENFIKQVMLVKQSGGNMVQIFLPMKNFLNEKESPNKYKTFLQKNNIHVTVHASYIYNLARDWDKYSPWMNSLELEIKYAYLVGAKTIVIHLGKKMDLSKQEAMNNMYTALIYLHNKTSKYKSVKLLIETSTGQGSEMCYKLHNLANFYKKFKKIENKEIRSRIKLCLDTCHVFSAGYNLKTKNDAKLFIETFEELIGLKYVKLIHLNDSKVDCGEQKDRHQNIGKGYIGLTGLKYLFNYFKKINIPMILETPNQGFLTEIKLLLC